jgi:hypothetical protein
VAVLVVVTFVLGVPVPVVQVVDVVAVLHCLVAAALAEDVLVVGRHVLPVCCRGGHRSLLAGR